MAMKYQEALQGGRVEEAAMVLQVLLVGQEEQVATVAQVALGYKPVAVVALVATGHLEGPGDLDLEPGMLLRPVENTNM